jgi:hypothetical protein
MFFNRLNGKYQVEIEPPDALLVARKPIWLYLMEPW